MNNIDCTIVTAFYDFEKKKHSTESYKEWIKKFLPFSNANMIIFTDGSHNEFLLDTRKEHLSKTKIIVLSLQEFYTYKYLEHWKKDLIRDHEHFRHSIELYMIWNEKSMFLKRAIEMNPFNTEYFCWADIGMIRDDAYIPYIRTFPRIRDTINKNKIYLLNIQHIFNAQDEFKELASERYRYINAIGGTIIFGNQNNLLKWVHKYYNILKEFVSKDLFAGKDQSLMACLYVKNKDLIQLVRPQPSELNEKLKVPFHDDWFYLVFYLS